MDTFSCIDPNADLPADILALGVRLCGSVFRRCRMEPVWAPGFEQNGILMGSMGQRRFVLYTRVTREDEVLEGAGPVPPILADAALALQAEPLLVRVHMTEVGQGTGFEYHGLSEVEARLKSVQPEWNRLLLRGKTVEHYLRLLKGRVSEFRVSIDQRGGGKWEDAPDQILSFRLRVNGKSLVRGGAISPYGLVGSAFASDEFWIFTCTCGTPECAYINRGVVVVHEGGHTLWKSYSLLPARIFIFETRAYKAAILEACQRLLRRAGQIHGEVGMDPQEKPQRLHELLYKFAENPGCEGWQVNWLRRD